MPKVFFSYSHADEALRDQIETQLALLKRQGIIDVWHDRRIGAGREFAREIDQHVESDEIILLLVSADFLASDYCYEKEMLRALTRHDAGEAVVIPVILRACDWHGAPFGKLNAVPRDGKPITQFADRDAAMLEVARAVRSVAERFGSVASPKKSAPDVARSNVRRCAFAAKQQSAAGQNVQRQRQRRVSHGRLRVSLALL
ncbi:toll/interleukin-1 receptor domain-containing protein [Rhodopseudomonas palustris]|uniref:toll/interleukin-1 receptor domain-containing protein n=1 Tax=Rhodopseudomonas palustris TaxID=1076 RepID=UPI0020CBCAE1|nr:toll/interleukin-1 receptor domain-containing protein [Rhodopseudomonas palustris]MCP9625845.1 toll/interleukin-1 receptor domain-containing protein [Rhodopseudomonas palustris]